MLKQTNLAQIITVENPKLGPDNNSTAISIYIYIYKGYVQPMWCQNGHFILYFTVETGKNVVSKDVPSHFPSFIGIFGQIGPLKAAIS